MEQSQTFRQGEEFELHVKEKLAATVQQCEELLQTEAVDDATDAQDMFSDAEMDADFDDPEDEPQDMPADAIEDSAAEILTVRVTVEMLESPEVETGL